MNHLSYNQSLELLIQSTLEHTTDLDNEEIKFKILSSLEDIDTNIADHLIARKQLSPEAYETYKKLRLTIK